MTSQQWNDVLGECVPVRFGTFVGVTHGRAKDVCGIPGVYVVGVGRAPLAQLEVADEGEARAALIADAGHYLWRLHDVDTLYPVAELERAHRDLVAGQPSLAELAAHRNAVLGLYSRWQGEVYAD